MEVWSTSDHYMLLSITPLPSHTIPHNAHDTHMHGELCCSSVAVLLCFFWLRAAIITKTVGGEKNKRSEITLHLQLRACHQMMWFCLLYVDTSVLGKISIFL